MSRHITRPARLAVAAAAAAALALPLAACSSDDRTTVTWSTWGNPEETARYKDFDTQYMAANADIKLNFQPTPSYDDYHSKLMTQLTSGTAPDVFYVGDDKIGSFVAAGVLEPLDPFLDAADSAITETDFADGLYASARQDGVVYGIPVDCNPDVLFYDKQALAAAGITEDPATLAENGEWTVNKFLEMTGKLKGAGLNGALFWNYWATHYSWISVNGGTAFDDSGAFVANTDPAAQKAVATLGEKFADGEFVVADTLPDGAGADTLFLTHQAGFFSQGRYTIGTIKEGGEEDSYDIAPWPTLDGAPKPTGVAAAYLVMNKKSEVKDAAWNFMSAYLDVDGQTFRLGEGGNAVPSIIGADNVVLDGYPAHAQTFLDARDNGFEDHITDGSVPGLSGDVSALFLELYQGKADATTTLNSVADLIASKQNEG